jgi:hypothetical protein
MSATDTASSATSARVIGRPWRKGESGNKDGRPKAPVDIAALARQHGPRAIAVAVELLEDPDSRIRLGALVALLDRGYGRPRQALEISDATSSLMMHLAAATRVSAELQRRGRPVIDGRADAVEPPPADLLNAPLPLE